MKFSELEENEIYYCKENKLSFSEFLIKYKKNKYNQYDNVKLGYWYNKLGFFSDDFVNSNSWRIATKGEKQYFLHCEKLNKFIPLSEIKEEPINILSKLELW
jgi:hypothetical protein